MNIPSPPVVAAWISGFVVGVLITLLVSGAISAGSSSKTDKTTPVPVSSVRDQSIQARIQRMATHVLGPAYPTGPKSRLLHVSVLSATARDGAVPSNAEDSYRSIEMTFRLNDHPLGRSWRLREAKADVFALMKSIYTSGLPIYNTELVGQFARAGGNSYTAVVAYLTYQTARKIPWKRWGRTSEGRLWNVLDYRDVSTRFG